MIRISQVQLPVDHTQAQLESSICKKLRVNENAIESIKYSIVKRSLDARNKDNITYNYVIDVTVDNEKNILEACRKSKTISWVQEKRYSLPVRGQDLMSIRPYVIGSGPAGLFAAYFLAEHGYKPILIERGESVEKRTVRIHEFLDSDQPLNVDSNVQFGEGGAGTFSDGKLTTGVNDPKGRNRLVLQTFIDNGAPEEILYQNKPHLGTDLLCRIIKNMRKKIIKNGGEVVFNTKFVGFSSSNGQLDSIKLESTYKGRKHIMEVDCNNLILAIGHSARDTFRALYEQKIHMEQKAFAVGVRIEHSQEAINKAQYGENYLEKYGALLPVADYKLTARTKDGRSVYTFCMCPGGYVINSSSEENRLCVNGMSFSQRDGENANSAIVVSITPDDYASSDNPLEGVEFQRMLEENAYKAAGGKIPVQLLKDFVEGNVSDHFGSVYPNCLGNCDFADINTILPDYICDAIKESLDSFDKTIKGFADPEAVLSAVESRTSSPVRIVRDEHFESNIKGIFPCGEGAGYAGGITSAAMDGIKVFEEIYSRYKS
ncbi:MAG: FAD-dependent oxidoreductase [Lachnospiraceae bacterium]|nr:FAD-dependent oxidoreductase [Lachnospiraceae bacterium]